MECAGEVGTKCSCHAPRLPRNAQEGSKLFSLEPKRAPTSSEWKLPPTTGRDSGLDPKNEGAAPGVAYGRPAGKDTGAKISRGNRLRSRLSRDHRDSALTGTPPQRRRSPLLAPERK